MLYWNKKLYNKESIEIVGEVHPYACPSIPQPRPWRVFDATGLGATVLLEGRLY